MLQRLGTQIELDCDTKDVYALCASDGSRHALMISNVSGTAHELNIQGVNLKDARWSILDERRLLSWSPPLTQLENNCVVLIEF